MFCIVSINTFNMNSNNLNIKTPKTLALQYVLLTVFTLFSLYFSLSAYRAYHMHANDLKIVTDKVEQVIYHKAKGKQAKPEIWINLSESGKYRVAYGNNNLLHGLTSIIASGDVVTLYLNKPQHAFLNFGITNDVLQIVKRGQVVYSLEIPQQSYHTYFIISAILSIMLPLICIFFWEKSKKNDIDACIQKSHMQQHNISVG